MTHAATTLTCSEIVAADDRHDAAQHRLDRVGLAQRLAGIAHGPVFIKKVAIVGASTTAMATALAAAAREVPTMPGPPKEPLEERRRLREPPLAGPDLRES